MKTHTIKSQIRLDSDFFSSPSFDALSNDAFATWVRLAAYCVQHGTKDGPEDGRMRITTAMRLAQSPSAEAVLDELCDAGLIDLSENEFLSVHGAWFGAIEGSEVLP